MSTTSPPIEMYRSPRWLLPLAVVSLTVVMLGALVYVSWLLLTVPSGSESDLKVLAAVLGLVGVVASGAVTLAGFILKHSIDLNNGRLAAQAERRLQEEADHNRNVEQEAELRLKVETAIKAVDLMGGTGAGEVPDGKRAGALFALASLNQLDFALALLENLWAKAQVDAVSAVWLVNRGLLAGGELEKVAVNILRDNVHRLHHDGGNHMWPGCLDAGWLPRLKDYTRERLLETLFEITRILPRSEWKEGFLLTMVVRFYAVASTDPDPRLRHGAALALSTLREVLELKEHETIYSSTEPVQVSDILKLESDLLNDASSPPREGASANLLKAAADLKEWAGLAPTATTADRKAMPMTPSREDAVPAWGGSPP